LSAQYVAAAGGFAQGVGGVPSPHGDRRDQAIGPIRSQAIAPTAAAANSAINTTISILARLISARSIFVSSTEFAQVGFVDRRHGLQSMAWTFAVHIGLGQTIQFPAPWRSQFFQGGLISGAPGKG
jgi:hypothetical protein